MKKFLVILWSGLLFLLCPVSFAQTPEDMRAQAFEDVQQATEFFNRANRLVSVDAGENNLRQALDLYVQAGQLYERAANIFQALGTQYVSQEDLEGIQKALQACLASIRRTQEQLQVLQQNKYGH